LIPKSFDPLKKFEVILESTFYEAINRDWFVDVVGCESLLEDLEILDVFVFILGIELMLNSSY
jgi:hypothetical protein